MHLFGPNSLLGPVGMCLVSLHEAMLRLAMYVKLT
jgi:hypothetical protein